MTADHRTKPKSKQGPPSDPQGATSTHNSGAAPLSSAGRSAPEMATNGTCTIEKNSGSGEPDGVLTKQSNGLPFTRQQMLKFLRADRVLVRRRAEYLLGQIKPELDAMPIKTIVIVDLVSGQHVRAHSRHAALDAFEEQFGVNQTVGWLHEVGGGVLLGGGVGKG